MYYPSYIVPGQLFRKFRCTYLNSIHHLSFYTAHTRAGIFRLILLDSSSNCANKSLQWQTTQNLHPQQTASSVQSVTPRRLNPPLLNRRPNRLGFLKRSIYKLPPFPVDIDSSSSAAPATSFSAPPKSHSRPKACAAPTNST
jgi:hypothetical protein